MLPAKACSLPFTADLDDQGRLTNVSIDMPPRAPTQSHGKASLEQPGVHAGRGLAWWVAQDGWGWAASADDVNQAVR
jgi:hypothetical protein